MERLWREMKIPKFYCMHVCKDFGDVYALKLNYFIIFRLLWLNTKLTTFEIFG